ncbi:MAG: glycosyltransferase, partial [Betaproteobacteria bacterium]|nr:glycosyltransferase [Betaproteobacteria bacterium]
MAANGQLPRLTQHVQAYLDAGHAVRYYSGLANDPPTWIAEMRRPIVTQSLKRAILRPLVDWSMRECHVLRATSLLGTLPALTARLVWGTPFVVSAGADYVAIAKIHGRPTLRWSVIHALAARFAAAIIVPNEDHAARLIDRYPHAAIIHIPNWVDTERFAPAPAQVTYPTVLYVGRLVREKNLERLARVCRSIDADLVCVGAGPLRDELVRRGVKCPGAVEWTDLPRWYT